MHERTADREQSLLRQPLRSSRREAAAQRVLHHPRGHGAGHRAGLLRGGLPARPVRGPGRDEPLHAARRRRRRARARFRLDALRRLRDGGADQRADQGRRQARALRGQGVRRRGRAGRHDHHQHRRPQRRFRAPLPGAREDPHRRRGPAGHASAQGRVHAAHRAGDGQEAAAVGARGGRTRGRAGPLGGRGTRRPRATRARAHVELFAAPAAPKPRVELFGSTATTKKQEA